MLLDKIYQLCPGISAKTSFVTTPSHAHQRIEDRYKTSDYKASPYQQ